MSRPGPGGYRQQDYGSWEPPTPSTQPPFYYSSPQRHPVPPSFSPGSQSPFTFSQPSPYHGSFTSYQNDRLPSSTATSPTPTNSGIWQSFPSNTSVSEAASTAFTYFCVHPDCRKKTFCSPSTLIKHDRETHCNRLAVCDRCPLRSRRIYHHSGCDGRVSFRFTEREGGYPCGWCERHFDKHADWAKHVVDHQRNGMLRDDYDEDRHSAAGPSTATRSPCEQNTFNSAMVAAPNQFASPNESYASDPQTPSPANPPADLDNDPQTSPETDSSGFLTTLAPSFPAPNFSMARNAQMAANINEFEGMYYDSDVPHMTGEEVPPSQFEFPIPTYQDPLPTTRHYSSFQYSYQGSPPPPAETESLEDTRLAEHTSAPYPYVRPQDLLSDAGSWEK